MVTVDTAQREQPFRICMPTYRNFAKRAFQCGLYEAQDILAETGDVDLIHLDASWVMSWLKGPQRMLLYHDISRHLIYRNPGIRPIRLNRDYDLFVAVLQTCFDLPYINAIEGWKDRCKVSACWIDEIWASSMHDFRYFINAFRQFDYVFVGYRGSVEPLSKAIGKPCHWLPGGVDAIRFASISPMRNRPIDVYSVGRRREGIHRNLLKAADRHNLFYLYDTFPTASDKDVYDHVEHRKLYANVLKRSQFFIVAPCKMDELKYLDGQIEPGYRYFEGAAAGAVLLGEVPSGKAFEEMFPWADSVVPVAADGADVAETIARLKQCPERLEEIRRNGMRGVLLNHDWAYRWIRMLQTAGMEPSGMLRARESHLKELAAAI